MPGRPRRDLLPRYFCATATGPLGGSLHKRGLRGVEAGVRFSDFDLPVIEVEAYLDDEGTPCVCIRARHFSSQEERLFYEGPLAQALQGRGSEAPAATASGSIWSHRCLGCRDIGWILSKACPEDDSLGEIRACECGLLASDEEALAAARAAGLSVDDLYQVFSVP
jgi:hypothetical protein